MREVPPAITKKSAQGALSEIEGVVTSLRRCFVSGKGSLPPQGQEEGKPLSIDDLAELSRYVAAYYSWAVTIWGALKGMFETAEQVRKLREANAFLDVKRGSKIAVKEAEAEASAQIEDFINDEIDWRLLFNRANAAKLAFESFARSVDSLKYIRSREWSATE